MNQKPFAGDNETFAAQRHKMVEEQLRLRGIHDPRVLHAFETIPRHLFVPEESHSWAYADSPQLIGHDQTISQPYIAAMMIQTLRLTGAERVLEVGTGSGYQAAILACLAADVHTVEIIPELAERAKGILAQLGLANAQVHVGDGSQGWRDFAPYDAIVVAAAAPHVPAALLGQLSSQGRMILPVGRYGYQQLEVWWREENRFEHRTSLPVAFVPLRGKNGWPGGRSSTV
jgi:protein-L-isoaspartate(D-aspartate) O-methyltransferase